MSLSAGSPKGSQDCGTAASLSAQAPWSVLPEQRPALTKRLPGETSETTQQLGDKDQPQPSLLTPFPLEAAQSPPFTRLLQGQLQCWGLCQHPSPFLLLSSLPLPSLPPQGRSHLWAAHRYSHGCHVAHELLHDSSLPPQPCNSPSSKPCVIFTSISLFFTSLISRSTACTFLAASPSPPAFTLVKASSEHVAIPGSRRPCD